jgi:hypothetical protein
MLLKCCFQLYIGLRLFSFIFTSNPLQRGGGGYGPTWYNTFKIMLSAMLVSTAVNMCALPRIILLL